MRFFSAALLLPLASMSGNEATFGWPRESMSISVNPVGIGVNEATFRFDYPTTQDLATVLASVGINAPDALVSGSRTLLSVPDSRGIDSFHLSGCGGVSVELRCLGQTRELAGSGWKKRRPKRETLDPDEYLKKHLTAAGRQLVTDRANGLGGLTAMPTLGRVMTRTVDLRGSVSLADILGFRSRRLSADGLAVSNGEQEIVLTPPISARARGIGPGPIGMSFALQRPAELKTLVSKLRAADYDIDFEDDTLKLIAPGGTPVTILA